jgi:hypothetical protein
MHEAYIIPGVVDGEVVRKQAYARLQDKNHPEETRVHAHRYGEMCNYYCKDYLFESRSNESTNS